MAFATLHRLLRPVLGLLDRLPAPQARALRSALGQEDDVTVQPFLVALATLSMLTAASEDAPVLCVIDDAQWLDQATADAVLVASRRLGADRVAGSIRLSTLGRLGALDRFDAAIRAGDREQAAVWVKQLVPFADGTQWPWALAAVDHGRAVLAEPAHAPALFESALAHHAQAGGHPYDQARTHLAYGEFLRRSQRRVGARTHLRSALETIEDLRAEPLAARATQELRASGETARKRDPSTLLKLTPMDRQVAELVGQGRSNKDIAAQSWVSHRTVAFHLRNIFTKAGVTSRGELAQLDLS